MFRQKCQNQQKIPTDSGGRISHFPCQNSTKNPPKLYSQGLQHLHQGLQEQVIALLRVQAPDEASETPAKTWEKWSLAMENIGKLRYIFF